MSLIGRASLLGVVAALTSLSPLAAAPGPWKTLFDGRSTDAWRGYGRDAVPDNPSVQPLDYTTSTVTALAFVWAVAGVWVVVRLATSDRGTRRPRTRATPGGHPMSQR